MFVCVTVRHLQRQDWMYSMPSLAFIIVHNSGELGRYGSLTQRRTPEWIDSWRSTVSRRHAGRHVYRLVTRLLRLHPYEASSSALSADRVALPAAPRTGPTSPATARPRYGPRAMRAAWSASSFFLLVLISQRHPARQHQATVLTTVSRRPNTNNSYKCKLHTNTWYWSFIWKVFHIKVPGWASGRGFKRWLCRCWCYDAELRVVTQTDAATTHFNYSWRRRSAYQRPVAMTTVKLRQQLAFALSAYAFAISRLIWILA